MKQENRSVRKTKAALQRNLIRLLGEKPINKISVKELTEASDLNRATFYLHYSDIYALMEDVEESIIRDVHELLQPIQMARPIDMLEPLFEYMYEKRDTLKILLSDSGNMAFFLKLIESIKQFCFELWKQYFNFKNDELYEYCFSFISAGTLSVARIWVSEGMKKSPREVSEMIEQMILFDITSILK